MRLEGIEKMGYYPTPTSLHETIASWLTPPKSGTVRLLDPCCGKGEFEAAVAECLRKKSSASVITWGAELSQPRAEEAAKALDLALATAWENTILAPGSISLQLLNPPYDWDGVEGKRLELHFLRSTAKKLRPDGVLVYIIPQSRIDVKIAKALSGYYDDLRCFRFPDGEYEAFKQVVIFGHRRASFLRDDDLAAEALAWATAELPELPEGSGEYKIPAGPEKSKAGNPIKFRRSDLMPEDLLRETRRDGALLTRAWKDLSVPDMDRAIHPALPMKLGHVSMLLSANQLGTIRLEGEGGRPFLVKGLVVKDEKKVEEGAPDEKGESDENEGRWREKFVSTVTLLSHDGDIEVISDTEKLTGFMREHGEQLANHVIERNSPAYDLNPEPWEWESLEPLARDCHLVGREETGLFVAQKHTAIAAARAIEKHHVSIINAEMGWGKTKTAAGVMELLTSYPAIVICPSHMTQKWVREITETVPGSYAREARYLEDVQAFIRQYEGGHLPKKSVLVMSKERIKLGDGWGPAVITRHITHVHRGQRKILEVFCCPICGAPVLDKNDAYVDRRYLKRKRRFCAACDAPLFQFKNKNDHGGGFQEYLTREAARSGLISPEENGASRLTKRDIADGLAMLHRGKTIADWERHVAERRANRPEPNEDEIVDFTAMQKARRGRKRVRWPLAAYILNQWPGFFQLLVADEVHHYKAKSSDQGIYFHRLIRAMASHRILALTGTLFGGKSSTIFWLLYRMCSAVRREFGFHDERRWVARYGLLERTVKARESDTDGAMSGTRRYYERVKEIPGISPAIIRWLLPVTIFARLTDLGHRLPAYTEKVFVLDMENYQGAQYDQMDDILVKMMRLARSNGDNGMVSVWLQASLARPNSAFREEWVMRRIKDPLDPDDKGRRVRVLGPLLPAVAGGEWLGDGKPYLPSRSETDLVLPKSLTDLPVWLPKERWLQDYVAQEAHQGCKTLVFVRQTGTRDIRHRVKAALEAKGLRVGILSSNIAPTRREGWVEQHAPKLDVLITNPRLVETGLDLVQFSRGVFFEIEYSLYTLWQACRRIWRLGQENDVEIAYAVYEGTIEERALALMGRKMAAAQTLYGDEAAGAIVDESEGDFLAELAREVLSGAELPDLETLFARENEVQVVSTSVLGSPTAPTPVLEVGVSWAEMLAEYGKQRRKRRARKAPDNQVKLPGFDLAA